MTRHHDRQFHTIRPVLLGVFFAGGFAALVYQTIWQRMLGLFGGADVFSVTIIVAAFMAGLGFGGLTGGHLADRLGPRSRLWTFAACEAAVGLFALVSATLYYDQLYVRMGSIALSRLSVAGITFAVTLIPTFLMGMSLPLLARFPTPNRESPAVWVSQLYGWNTLGAATGSFVAVMMLFKSFDLRLNLQIGAAISGACAIAVLLLSRFRSDTIVEARVEAGPPAVATRTTFTFRTWLLLYALSGFVSLSLEIVWLRVFGVMLKSSAMTFGYLMAIYLGGIGLGSLLAQNQLFKRCDPTRSFLRLQSAVPLWAGLGLALLVAAVNHAAFATHLRETLARPDPSAAFEAILVTYLILPLLLIMLPTLMMGLSFGLLQRAVQTDVALVGRRVGWLQAANITGATLGAVVTGVVLLDALGSAGTLRVLAACGGVFLVMSPVPRRPVNLLAGVSLAAIIVAIMPNEKGFWATLHGGRPNDVIVGEDASGLVLFRFDANETKVFLGGMSQSWLPYGGVHTALGALPVLLHSNPVDIALIGLASGDTLFAIGGSPLTRTIESLEIMAPQLPALERVAELGRYPAVQILLEDPRVRHLNVDGRLYLRRTERRFDIVEADPLLPQSAAAGNLYSLEYFRLLRDRLKTGGFAVTWLPTKRTRDTFASVFPYMLQVGDIAIGSLSRIAYDPATVRARMASPFTSRYYARGGVDVAAILGPYLAAPSEVLLAPVTFSDLNRDLFPMDEFGIPYRASPPR